MIRPDDLHGDPRTLWAGLAAAAGAPALDQPPLPGGVPQFPHSLDPHQAQAAAHVRGPLRVLAPAGSGKTRTLTARIAALVNFGIAPEKILALAFNAKAAEEMRDRLESMSIQGIQARTFHALGYEIVRSVYGWTYTPENESRLEELAQAVLSAHLALPEHPGAARRVLRQAAERIQQAKSALLPAPEIELDDGETIYPLSGAFNALVAEQQNQGLLTFTDMIYFALRALLDAPDARCRLQQQFEYILVDEFQDLNRAQMLLLRILALPQNNLFVVGDDDQLIYAWRGAELEHILHFSRFYPNAGSVVLATNYRSGYRLVQHGRWLIEHNPERVAKDIRAPAHAPPGRLDISLHPTLTEQARAAAAWMHSRRRACGLDWSCFGVLFRVNKDAGSIESALNEAGIPFTTPGPADPDAGDPPPQVQPGRATLLTVHKAKGKEFPYVVFFNLSRRGGTARTETDERRVAYVGLSRAKTGLLITADSAQPSPFLAEAALNPALDDYAEPFLERRLAGVYRRRLLRYRDVRGWLASFSGLPPWADLRDPDSQNTDIESLATELHFRKILGVQKRP